MANRGVFITFEGTDGSGKTTQMRRLADRLRENSHTVVETVEPGGTRIGAEIRRILLDAANQDLRPTAELLLYFAARAQNVDEVILPALHRGDLVLSDRFTDSSLVYQGCGRELGSHAVLALDQVACRGLKPDLTLLIDIDLETSLARVRARNTTQELGQNRMDEQSLDFYRRVHEAYRALAAKEPDRIRIVDGNTSVEAVEQEVWRIVSAYV